jgi:hypothetical protein
MYKISASLAALALLAACEAPQPTAAPIATPTVAQMPFAGSWDCEVGTFTFTNETYQPGVDAAPMRMSNVETFGADTFGLTFSDGYAIGLMDVTSSSMTWSSPASGDVFECRKLR